MLQLVRMPEDFPSAVSFCLEGQDEAIDFEVRGKDDTPLLLAQAKTRAEPGGWNFTELIRLARRWDSADPTGKARLQFLSDAPVSGNGIKIKDLCSLARSLDGADAWVEAAKSIAPSGVPLRKADYAVFRRLEINTRLGPWVQILDQVKLEILRLSGVELDAGRVEAAANELFVKAFARSSERQIERRTISTSYVNELLAMPEAARKNLNPSADTWTPVMRNVPSAHNLRGRVQETAFVSTFLSLDPKAGERECVIAGLGGIGKSSVVRLYIHKGKCEYPFVWWIQADTAETILAEFRDFCEEEKGHLTLDDSQMVREVGRRLQQYQGRCLLVFDNAPSRDILQNLIPMGYRGDLIVTTRDSTWAATSHGLILEGMAEDEAMAWLGEEIPSASNGDKQRLLTELDRIPLAMAQAVAYMVATGCPISEYLELFEQHRIQLLDDPETIPHDYTQRVTIATAILICVHALSNHGEVGPHGSQKTPALEILGRCALLSPELIPLKLASLDLPSGPAVYAGIRALRRFSLIQAEAGFISIHRVVQEVVRGLVHDDSVEYFLERYQLHLAEEMVTGIKEQQWGYLAQIIEHGVAVARNVTSMGSPSGNTVALMANTAVAISNLHGDLGRGQTLLQEAMELLPNVEFADRAYRKAVTQASLAGVLYNLRKFQAAISVAQEAIDFLSRQSAPTVEGKLHLLHAYLIQMNTYLALDQRGQAGLAGARAMELAAEDCFEEEVRLGVLLEKAQVHVWTREWEAASVTVSQIGELLNRFDVKPSDVEIHATLLNAMVEAAIGSVDASLAIEGAAQAPSASPMLAQVRFVDDLVELAHAIAVRARDNHETGKGPVNDLLKQSHRILDRAGSELGKLPDPPLESRATIEMRRGVIFSIGSEVLKDRTLLMRSGDCLRRSIEMYEAGGFRNGPLFATAHRLLDLTEEARRGNKLLSELRGRESGSGASIAPPSKIPFPSNYRGGFRIPELDWAACIGSYGKYPDDAKHLFTLLAVLRYQLSGQRAPSPLFVAEVCADVLKRFGLGSEILATCLTIMFPNGRKKLEIGHWDRPPYVSKSHGLVGHFTLWVPDLHRMVDPNIQVHAPLARHNPSLKKVLDLPVVTPFPSLENLFSSQPTTFRDGHLLWYMFQPHWIEEFEQLRASLRDAEISRVGENLYNSVIEILSETR